METAASDMSAAQCTEVCGCAEAELRVHQNGDQKEDFMDLKGGASGWLCHITATDHSKAATKL